MIPKRLFVTLIMLFTSVTLFSQEEESPLFGTWVNRDSDSRGHGKIGIVKKGERIVLELYNTSGDKLAGEIDATSEADLIYGKRPEVSFQKDQGFKVTAFHFKLKGSRLYVESSSTYTDNSGRSGYKVKEVFEKR